MDTFTVITLLFIVVLCICLYFIKEALYIKGVILIATCHKHFHTRVQEFKLSKTNYDGWKVMYVIGDPMLDRDYSIVDNIITLKCEDSYVHIIKKVVLAMKLLFSMYTITEGILASCDDVLFNERALIDFLNNTDKSDFMGKILNYVVPGSDTTKIDNWIPNHYKTRVQELQDPYGGIPYTLDEMLKFNIVPNCLCIEGVITYFSKRACTILIKHLEERKWDVFAYDEKYGYIYVIADIGVGHIMQMNNIPLTQYDFYTENQDELANFVCRHTNKFK